MLTRLARYRRDEAGSSLILALILVAILGVGLAAVLGFSDTSIKGTVAVRTAGNNTYAANAAVQGAINAIRSNASLGVSQTYTGGVNTCTVPTMTVDSVTPTVTCQGVGSSGQPGGGDPNNLNNTPTYAILTLSTATSTVEDGLNIAIAGGGNQYAVSGSVYSDSDVSVGPGSMLVTGTVNAHAGAGYGCSGTITTVPSGGCLTTTTSVSDPGVSGGSPVASWNPLVSSPPAVVTVSATNPAPCSAGTETFSPGTYQDPSALQTRITGCAIAYFSPGAYYFNFPGDNAAAMMTLNGATIIAGTPSASGTTCDPTKPGAQFIFGGASHISASNLSLTICADPLSSSRQQIALYGVRSTNAPPGYAPESGCVATPGGCSLISTTGSGTNLQVTGTAYVPSAQLNLKYTLNANTIFYRGVVARSVTFQPSGSVPPSVPNVFLPVAISSGAAANRTVLFVATVAGRPRVTATVTFDDNTDTTTPGKYVTVTAWSASP